MPQPVDSWQDHQKRHNEGVPMLLDIGTNGDGYLVAPGKGLPGRQLPQAPLKASAKLWNAMIDALAEPDYELMAEDFAALLSVYKLCKRDGMAFDPALVALMAVLERQAADTVEALEDNTDNDEDCDYDAL